MSKVKIIAVMVILFVVVVFTLQNTELVEINFLFWHVSLSRALVLFLVFTLGMLTGFVLSILRHDNGMGNDQSLIED